METYPFALYWRPDCLFEWQVILDKQITPWGEQVCVVFLQQIVALPNN